MADFDYYGADYGVEQPSRLMEALRNFGVANWAGALTSLSLTAGLAVWAIDLTFRDVSGVPVIRAIEGPMRVAPEEPGGSVAPFQGLALSDITSGGSAAPAPDQIVLAPPPVSMDAPALAERTTAAAESEAAELEAAQLEAAGSEDDVAEDDVAEAGVAMTTAEAVEVALSEAMSEGVGTATAEGPAMDVAGLDEGDRAVQGEDVSLSDNASAPSGQAATALAVPTAGVARSARPTARPDGLRRVASLPTDAPALAAGVQVASLDAIAPPAREVDPASVTAGTRVVQLGAFDSELVARSEWDRLENRFSDYMAGKNRMIQKATSGGRDFWRLRVVGFDDASDARRFCAELLARDAACIPVTVR